MIRVNNSVCKNVLIHRAMNHLCCNWLFNECIDRLLVGGGTSGTFWPSPSHPTSGELVQPWPWTAHQRWQTDTREDVVGWTRGQNAVRKPSQASLSQNQTCFQDNRWMSCHLLCWKKPMRWPNPVVDVLWETGTLGSSQTTSSLFTCLVGYLKGGYYAFPCGSMHILASENNVGYEAKCLCKFFPTQTWFSLMLLCGWKYILYVSFVLNVSSI